MERKINSRIGLLSFLLFFSSSLFAINSISQDTCAVNDFCETAIPIENVIADGGFVCVDGCTIGSTPEFFNNDCLIGVFPTVWYSVITEGGTLMNIHVSSNEIENPAITLFQVISDCGDLVQIPLSQGNLPCLVGSNGVAESIGTDIASNTRYVIAVSSYDKIGGEFTLCISTISAASFCVTDKDLTIEARSGGTDLSGPFKPGEKVSICMNVNAYSAAGNGCQWFQGLVPVFGNGWDPSSFDQNGQPLNTTLNGNAIGQINNGLYGAATWDWFSDVDYHYRDTNRQIGDFDGNGTVDMCSTLYDPDCPNIGGITGGCCGPCWGAPLGDFLPPGWFAYGINGSCASPGPPVRVDWGDGNTCGGGMGPWNFCFDLVVREYPDCLVDATTSDLTIGFFTFADGEVGSWTGAASVCALDQPVMVSFPMRCAEETDLGIEFAEDKCADDVFGYVIDEPGIDHWTWDIFPSWAVQQSLKSGENGYAINDTLINLFQDPVEVTYYFTGYEDGTSATVIKQVRFRIIPGIRSSLPDIIHACERDKDSMIISALPLSGGLAPFSYMWHPGGETTPAITIFPPFQNTAVSLDMVDSIGCTYHKDIRIQVRPCQLDTIMPDDESNDTQTDEDPPHGGGNYATPGVSNSSLGIGRSQSLKVYPVPASDYVQIEWPATTEDAKELAILDLRGVLVHQVTLTPVESRAHRLRTNVEGYPEGVYLVMLKAKQGILTAKLVKM